MTIDSQTDQKYASVAQMVDAAVVLGSDASRQRPSKEDALEFIRDADAHLRDKGYAITPYGRWNVDQEWQLVWDVCAMAQVVTEGDDDVAKAVISHLARRGSEQAYRGITRMLCSSERTCIYEYSVMGQISQRSWGEIKKQVPLKTTYPHLAQYALEMICAVEFRNIHGYVAANQISAECIEPTRRKIEDAFSAAANDGDANQAKGLKHQYDKRLIESSLGFLTSVAHKDALQMMVYAVHDINYFCSNLPLTLPLQVVFERRAMAQEQGTKNLEPFNETISGVIRRIIDLRQLERERNISGDEWFTPIITRLREANMAEEGLITAFENYLYQETQRLAAEELAERHKASAKSARPAVGGLLAELTRK